MKILDFVDFAAYPVGTIFCFLDDGDGYTRDFCRKDKTLYGNFDCPEEPVDFFFTSILPRIPFYSDMKTLEEFNYEPGLERWGEFDDTVRYIVYDQTDITILKEIINNS